jgi:hypothetical protein
MFKAIEVDATSRQRTGRELTLDADTRQAAIDALLATLSVAGEAAHVDPTRTVVRIGDRLWTLVRASPPREQGLSGSQRRAGAKHKQVR